MKRVALWGLALGLACLCACGAPSANDLVDQPAATAAELHGTDGMPGEACLEPLSYTRAEQEYMDASFISYPYLMDVEYDAINHAIQSAIRALFDALEGATYTDCEIMCNDCGVFSVRITVRDLVTNEVLAVTPLTFDTAACAQLSLKDLFDPENERWRGLIPDIVMLQAEKAGVTLLCEVMPAADDQAFYVTEDALVILYRPYEIATYSAGWPEFSIPLSQLAEFFLQGSPLERLAVGGSILRGEVPAFYGNEKNSAAYDAGSGHESKEKGTADDYAAGNAYGNAETEEWEP